MSCTLYPPLAADNLCVYVDAGGEPKVDPAVVVAQLKSWSVREVHLGAFYGSEGFETFTPRFLAAAHRQGIAVYAWLEYPMVSQEFWDQHPEWREVTANGHQAIMDWRHHMALEDPACFQAVAELTRRLVLDYDWDGVDFAELYFEGDARDFQAPEGLHPHASHVSANVPAALRSGPAAGCSSGVRQSMGRGIRSCGANCRIFAST